MVVATIGAPQGVRGEVRVRPWTDDPMSLKRYRPLLLPDGRAVEVTALRPHKGDTFVARLKGVDDREAAAALTNLDLSVPRGALPPVEEDEFLLDDLVGLHASSADGRAWGEVVAVHDFGAGEVLELKAEAVRTVMIPFSEAAVPEIDLEAGALTVEPIAAGLEDAPDEE